MRDEFGIALGTRFFLAGIIFLACYLERNVPLPASTPLCNRKSRPEANAEFEIDESSPFTVVTYTVQSTFENTRTSTSKETSRN